MVLTTMSLTLLSSTVIAKTNCDYTHVVGENFTHKIESMTNYERKVFPYIEDTRACVVSMNVKIDGISYHTKGKFVFGPDQTETKSCMQAEVRAKQNIIRQVSPELLSSNTTMDCKPAEKLKVVEYVHPNDDDITTHPDFLKGWAKPIPQRSNRQLNFGTMLSGVGLALQLLN